MNPALFHWGHSFVSFNFRLVNVLMVQVTKSLLFWNICSFTTSLISWTCFAIIFSWSWCSCGTPKYGFIASRVIVENHMIELVSPLLLDLSIISSSWWINEILVALYLETKPCLRVDLHFRIFVAGVPGLQEMSFIRPIVAAVRRLDIAFLVCWIYPSGKS